MTDGTKPQNFREALESYWNIPAQVASWILSLIGGFFRRPPSLNPEGQDTSFSFAQFLATAFIGLLLIPILKWQRRQAALPWFLTAIFSLLVCIATYLTYDQLLKRWTVTFRGSQVLIGPSDELTEAAKSAIERDHLDKNPPPKDLLEIVTGGPQAIWNQESLDNRAFVLGILYIFSVPVFALCIISVIQSIYCYTR